VRAAIRALAGRELQAAQQRNPEIAVEIEIRGLASAPSAGMRATHRSVSYPILDVRDPDLSGRRLLLDCAQGAINDAVTQ
jgi:head-tail adaptor